MISKFFYVLLAASVSTSVYSMTLEQALEKMSQQSQHRAKILEEKLYYTGNWIVNDRQVYSDAEKRAELLSEFKELLAQKAGTEYRPFEIYEVGKLYSIGLGSTLLLLLSESFNRCPEQLALVTLLLASGANINFQERESFETPLMKAVRLQNLPLVSLFISDPQLDLTLKNRRDETALNIAAKIRNTYHWRELNEKPCGASPELIETADKMYELLLKAHS